VTGVLAGTLGALFGGTKLGVSGPAAAMSMLVCNVVRDYGLTGLAFTTLICGGLQFLTGALKAGGVIKFIPSPLVAGFMAGIGALIVSRQATAALGVADSKSLTALLLDPSFSEMLHLPSIGLAGMTVMTAMIIPRFFPKAPSIMIAATLSTLAQVYFGFPGVEMVGALPASLPAPSLPHLPSPNDMGNILLSSVVFYGIASLESLLSSAALDKLSHAKKPYDSNKELMAQGISNMTCSFFGGLPATSVIARSSLSVMAGAKTRRASLVHASLLLGSVYLLSPVFSYIPVPTLAGVLIAAGFRMLNPAEIKHIYSVSPIEVLPAAFTFGSILITGDLITAVGMGLISSFVVNYMKKKARLPLAWNLSGNKTNEQTDIPVSHDTTVIVPSSKPQNYAVDVSVKDRLLSYRV